MIAFFRKLSAFALLSIGLFTALFGASDTSNLAFQQGQAINPQDLPVGYNAPGCIDLKDGWDTCITGSFIFWQALADELFLARSDVSSTPGYPTFQTYYEMDFDYKPGFKVAVSRFLNHDNWDVQAKYTWLHLKNKASYSISEFVLIPSFYTANSGTVSAISGRWKVMLDLVDLELGRSFYVGNHLIARVFVGGKGGRIDQKYESKPTVLSGGVNYYPKYQGKIESWKIGTRTGSNLAWFFTKEFRFSFDAALDLLYSHYKVTFDNSIYSSTYGLYNLTAEKKNGVVQPVLETALGLGWGTYLLNERYHVDFSLVYEFQAFLGENQFLFEGVDTDQGGLYLQGGTLSARFDF